MAAALDARGIGSAGNLVAEVEGDIEDVAGVLKISRIRLRYRFSVPSGMREKAERALAVYSDACPAYQSIKGCIECTWTADIRE
ncbi:MAG: OsmC family protein [Thermodesulfobacteriota bacterium]